MDQFLKGIGLGAGPPPALLFHPLFITVSQSGGTLRANQMCAATIHPLLRLAWLLLVRGLLVTVHPERFFLQHWGETAGEFLENEPSEPAATLPESNDNLKNPYLPQQ